MRGVPAAAAIGLVAALLGLAGLASAATWEPRLGVRGAEILQASVGPAGGASAKAAWDDLGRTSRAAGAYRVRVETPAGVSAVEIPQCAGRQRVEIDGQPVSPAFGPIVLPLGPGPHEVVLTIAVSAYEKRIACGDRPRVGVSSPSSEGLRVLTFSSPASDRGGGRAVVFIPPRHDSTSPRPLLVGLHPWNGSMWTYAAYAELLQEARARDVVLLMPSGLGNSLYTADAEDEVMRAIEALSSVVAVDAGATSLWGASMGGAGATTIAFHHPDRFASVTSFFGDSKYDRSTYVRSILASDAAAHAVNAADVVENARYLPVWLIHGEDDRTSPIRQSEILAEALQRQGFAVRFDRVPNEGHSGALVARFVGEVVARAASARVPVGPERVTYRSVRASDTEVYGVRIVRASSAADAFIDLARDGGVVHVRKAVGVRSIVLARGALGSPRAPAPPIAVDDPIASGVDVRWGP
jgi:pimeloyl-ACP methyl ester carboxylesterase